MDCGNREGLPATSKEKVNGIFPKGEKWILKVTDTAEVRRRAAKGHDERGKRNAFPIRGREVWVSEMQKKRKKEANCEGEQERKRAEREK